MKKILAYILPIICVFLLFSCDKEQKLYEGTTQIAFENATQSYNITSATTSISLQIQLISTKPQAAITATVAVNSESTCANAVTVPTSATIDAGRFLTNLTINVDHSKLAASSNRLILDLSATGIKVAENYDKVTITLNKL